MYNNISQVKQILVAIFGISTSFGTGIILGLIQVYSGYAIYSFTIWFVIPVGALLAGFGAASGYYAGAKLFQHKPTGGVLLNMVGASIIAFIIVHYIPYYFLEVNGIRVKEAISFWQYLNFIIRHASLSLLRTSASTGELGSFWGYIYAGLKLVGFSLGGLAVFGWLAESPYCGKCSRYLKKTGKIDRFTNDGELLLEILNTFAMYLNDKKFEEAIRFLSEKIKYLSSYRNNLRLRLITRSCPICNINHLELTVSKRDNDNWKDIKKSAICVFTEEKLEIISNS
jgi:hypothetical protein